MAAIQHAHPADALASSEGPLPELGGFPTEPGKANKSKAPEVVLLDYADLLEGKKDFGDAIERAYGDGGLGILAVRGIPGFLEARQKLLPLAWNLGTMEPKDLEKYELEHTFYCTGWSRGREKFQGKPDVAKGSFYANPIYDDPALGDDDLRTKFPYACTRNVWPTEVPELEQAFKDVGRIIYEAAKPVVKQCDAFVESRLGPGSGVLYDKTFEKSRLHLGRLLHYYANPGDCGEGGEGTWCGWHNDNSTITGLVPAMWIDESSGEELPSFVTETAGLHVKGRDGQVQRVRLPGDCLGLQIGEAAQILSGGLLRATPHQVRGYVPKPDELVQAISRESFALFMEPQWDMAIGPPEGATYEDVLRGEEREVIPPLSKRLQPDPETQTVEFGKLLGDSFQEYYKHNNPGQEVA